MLSDKRYGLSVNIMATRVMPSLLPQTVNPSLNLEQFTILIEVSILQHSPPTFCTNIYFAWPAVCYRSTNHSHAVQ